VTERILSVSPDAERSEMFRLWRVFADVVGCLNHVGRLASEPCKTSQDSKDRLSMIAEIVTSRIQAVSSQCGGVSCSGK
jgi:hypothetical protein